MSKSDRNLRTHKLLNNNVVTSQIRKIKKFDFIYHFNHRLGLPIIFSTFSKI